MGAALFGYTKLYGQVPGGQAEFLRVPQAHYGPIKVPEGPPDDRFVYLSDVLPTAWQAVEYANIPDGGTVAVFGLGPIGDMCDAHRQAPRRRQGHRHRPRPRADRARARERRSRCSTSRTNGDIGDALRELTDGRGPDSVIDAVGMEAHGAPFGKAAQQIVGLIPDAIAAKMMEKAGVDRLSVINAAIDGVRRGGTISLVGRLRRHGRPAADAAPCSTSRSSCAWARPTSSAGSTTSCRWSRTRTSLGVESFATHRLPLDAAPEAYETFQKKQDGAVKILLQP